MERGAAVGAAATELTPPTTDLRNPPNGNNHNLIKAVVEPGTTEEPSLTNAVGI